MQNTRWYDNPTHPVWGLILVVLIMVGAAGLSVVHASDFDETEIEMLREFAGWTVVVVFGGGGIARLLARNGNGNGNGGYK